MRTIGKVLLAPTIASGLIAGGAGVAHAAPAGYPAWFYSGQVSIFSHYVYSGQPHPPRLDCYGYGGQEFYVYSSIDTSQVWDYGQDLATSCKGWTPAYHLATS
jgi:hypothetical protein